jgi:NTP pyrophosphatase (non-canonical NTP hydrolase)
MKDIIEKNYDSTVKRGLITPSTNILDFLNKLKEEVGEFEQAIDDLFKSIEAKSEHFRNIEEELSDVILVGLNCAKHFDIDIEKQLIKKINTNYERSKRI